MKFRIPHSIAFISDRSAALMTVLPLLLALPLNACHANRAASHASTASHISSTSLTSDEKENCKRESEGRDDRFRRVPSYLPAQDGDICVTYRFMDDDKMSTLVARFEDSSKEPRWAINLTPQVADYGYTESGPDAHTLLSRRRATFSYPALLDTQPSARTGSMSLWYYARRRPPVSINLTLRKRLLHLEISE